MTWMVTRAGALTIIADVMKCSHEEAIDILETFLKEDPSRLVSVELNDVLKIKVECIGCKKRWDIDQAESKRLSDTKSVPMCSSCGSPAIVVEATKK